MEIYAWIESVFQIAVQYGILAMEALRRKTLFPQTGLETPEPGAERMVSRQPQVLNGKAALSLNSGFGGVNAAVLLEAES